MEAPEKIWVHELSAKELTVPLEEYHIEYVRADAFIEKACNFIDERLNFDDNAWHIEGEVTIKDKVIEEFKKYMKGE